MRGFKHILLIVGCVAALAACGHANKSEKKDVKNPTLSRDSILIGDQVVMSADFSVPDKAPIQVIPYAQTLAAEVEKDKIMRSDSADISSNDGFAENESYTGGFLTKKVKPFAPPALSDLLNGTHDTENSVGKIFNIDSVKCDSDSLGNKIFTHAYEGTVEVVHDFIVDTLSFKDGIRRLRARAIITSFDKGYYKLPSPVILIPDKAGKIDTIKFDERYLAVNSIIIDTTSFKPYQMGVKDTQMKYPITFRDFIPWILLLLLLAAIAYCITRYFKLKAQNKDFFGRSKIKIPPHVVALKKLEKLRDEKLWQSGKEKQYFTGITDTLREYIQKRYGFGAMEKTSTEIMDSLQGKEIEEKTYNNLGEMFKVADLVKFAKYSPLPDENENAIPAAENFVNFAYMQELKEQEERAAAAAKKLADKAARAATEHSVQSTDNKQNTKKTDGTVGNKIEEGK